MKTSQLGYLIALTLCFAACKKKDSTPEKIETKRLLVKITQVEDFLGTSFTTFSYDERLRLKVITDRFGLDTYTYDGDNIRTIETSTPGNAPGNKYTFSYENGKPIKIVQTFLDKTRIYGYVYSGEHVSEIHVSENGDIIDLAKYKFMGHNTVTKSYEGGSTVFTYGTKKNMYASVGLDYFIDVELFDRYSANELLEKKFLANDGSTISTMKNVYQYDKDGYPTTLVSTITQASGDTQVIKYSFEYEDRK